MAQDRERPAPTVLFVTSPEQDYLQDSCLHGLRSLLGTRCIDYPKKAVMYRSFDERAAKDCYGNLFGVWRLLDDIAIDRLDIEHRIARNEFDFIVFGSIHRSQALYQYWRHRLRRCKSRLIVLDGEDEGDIVAVPASTLYFKRELDARAMRVRYRADRRHRSLPWRQAIPGNVRGLAFSFPDSMLANHDVPKRTLFQSHIVDAELRAHPRVADRIGVPAHADASFAAGRGYVFDSQEGYYRNLAEARFGITTKRAGWDCFRHYEIAANGTVPCLKNGHDKPASCAPYGLTPANSVFYRDAGDLFRQIDALDDQAYTALRHASLEWARRQTTTVRAAELLEEARSFFF